MNVDYSCYEGREVTGGSDVVLSRGKIMVDGGEWLGARGDGRFLKRRAHRGSCCSSDLIVGRWNGGYFRAVPLSCSGCITP